MGIVVTHIVYEITDNFNIRLESCIFGAVKLTKNNGIDKYGYSDYGTEFDRHGSFYFVALDQTEM